IYCWDDKTGSWTQMDIKKMTVYLEHDIAGGSCKTCDREHMYRILKDWELTSKYGKAWEDKVKRFIVSETEKKYVY
ncbi:unnamed protein product, partial [Candidula unifasciata]